MGLLEGKVAFVTGAARGQGRSHAIRLAQEGADIIAVDACATPGWLSYPLATEADLAETVKEVEALDRRIIARKADIRDLTAISGRARRGRRRARRAAGHRRRQRRDHLLAAGHLGDRPAEFRELIDVTLTGTFITVKAAVPHHDHGGQRRLDHPDQLRARRSPPARASATTRPPRTASSR